MEQLWSDERIREVVRLHSTYRVADMHCLTAAAAEIELTRMRDDYEQRIDELEANLADVRRNHRALLHLLQSAVETYTEQQRAVREIAKGESNE